MHSVMHCKKAMFRFQIQDVRAFRLRFRLGIVVLGFFLGGCRSQKVGVPSSCSDHLSVIGRAVERELSSRKISTATLPGMLSSCLGPDSADLQKCPEDGAPYHFNVALGTLDLKSLDGLGEVPLVFDSNFVHRGKVRVLFCDGRVEAKGPKEFSQLCQQLQAKGLFRVASL